jgi:exodeoxyribonuclease VII large subunit
MADGIEVRIVGRVRWYAPRGTVQLRMHGIDPAFTLGRLEADRDRVLAALAADGLLARNGRLPMPAVPLRVGLITSRGSAAHADVLSELAASGLAFEVIDVDARTQGADCAASVSRALRALAVHPGGVDVVLVVRGGGARTDLAGFDSEQVARAIAAMDVPVLTGIGHEIDRSIADEVAHSAHKTPTAAAAAVVTQIRAFLHRLEGVAAATARAGRRASDVAERRLVDRSTRAARAATTSLVRAQRATDAHAHRLRRAASRPLDRAGRHLDGLAPRAAAHDPVRLLARGWSITTTLDGGLVRSVSDAVGGAGLRIRVADGTIIATTDEHHEEPA